MIFFGTRMFGKVHKAPSGMHVATQFFHISFFPLFPLGSYLVLVAKGFPDQGVKIPLNLFSLVIAYLRGITIASVLAIPAFVLMAIDEGDLRFPFTPEALPWLAFAGGWCAISLVGAFWSYLDPRVTKADAGRQSWMDRTLRGGTDKAQPPDPPSPGSSPLRPS